MSAKIINIQKVLVRSASYRLVVESDDYSVRVISDVAPLFWVRFLRTENDDVIISDFNAGGLPRYAFILALRKGMKELHISQPHSIIFTNVSASESLEAALVAIRRACESFAFINRRTVRSLKLTLEEHKLNVVVSLD